MRSKIVVGNWSTNSLLSIHKSSLSATSGWRGQLPRQHQFVFLPSASEYGLSVLKIFETFVAIIDGRSMPYLEWYMGRNSESRVILMICTRINISFFSNRWSYPHKQFAIAHWFRSGVFHMISKLELIILYNSETLVSLVTFSKTSFFQFSVYIITPD